MKKVIWITGGGTGIGKAVAIKFANQGWKVAISGRRENILKEVENINPNIKSFPVFLLIIFLLFLVIYHRSKNRSQLLILIVINLSTCFLL